MFGPGLRWYWAIRSAYRALPAAPTATREPKEVPHGNQAKCTAQVQMVGQLVQDLHNLIPLDGAVALGNRNGA